MPQWYKDPQWWIVIGIGILIGTTSYSAYKLNTLDQRPVPAVQKKGR